MLDGDLCQLCHAYGADKRSLTISCLYAVHEVVPEAIDLFAVRGGEMKDRGYYLRICKSCRGALLGRLREWRDERVALRMRPKDHDGYLEDEDDPTRNIPVRINGVIVMMNDEEFTAFKAKEKKETK